MKTYVLHIREANAPNDYPIELELWTAGGLASPMADPVVDTIPRDLRPKDFVDPFSPDEMREKFAEAGAADPDLRKIGEQLCELFDQSAIGEHLKGDDDDYRVLLDIEPTDLRSVPWELLTRDGDRLFSRSERPYLRGCLDSATVQLDHDWPLRLLVIVGCKPDDPDVDAEAEVRGIFRELYEWEPDIEDEILRQPSRTRVRSAIQDLEPHLLHFIGHGFESGGEIHLELHDGETGKTGSWTPDEIFADVPKGSLRLAVINACLGDAPPGEGRWSVADAFKRSGAAAVLTMLTKVGGEDATRFAVGFYQSLAAGETLDRAVVAGRGRVYEWYPAGDGFDRREWASPSLFVRATPECILSLGAGVALTQVEVADIRKEFGDLSVHVDRRVERRKAWKAICADDPRLIILCGPSEVGKSHFAEWVLQRLSMCGHEVRYVDYGPRKGGSFLDVLRRIRRGEPGSLSARTQELPADAFSDFESRIEGLLGDPDGKLKPEHRGHAVDLCSAFQKGLLEVADAGRPLTLVLDHIDAIETDEFNSYLFKELMLWSAKLKSTPSIRLFVVLRDTSYARFNLKKAKKFFLRIEFHPFQPEEWPQLAPLYLLHDFEEKTALENSDHYQKWIIEPWTPEHLVNLKNLISRR